MNEFVKILDTKAEELAPTVENIFLEVEKEGENPKYKKYTSEAQEQEKKKFADQKYNELQSIREKYISDCEGAINNTKMTVSKPVIVDSFSLETTRYKVIAKPLESQLELLNNTTNETDFNILKGIILEQIQDQATRDKIRSVELPSEDKLKALAIGQLRFRTIDINYIPSVKMSRATQLTSGLKEYLYQLIGVEALTSNIYFR